MTQTITLYNPHSDCRIATVRFMHDGTVNIMLESHFDQLTPCGVSLGGLFGSASAPTLEEAIALAHTRVRQAMIARQDYVERKREEQAKPRPAAIALDLSNLDFSNLSLD